MRLRGALLCTLAMALIAPGVAAAKDIHVRPGDGLQSVVNGASPGDVLRIHGGHYNPGSGTLTINKRLTLVGYNARPRIRGNCSALRAITVTHDDVVLNHLKMVKAAYADVDFRNGAEGGKAKDLKVEAKCEGGIDYGINIFQAGAMEVVDNIGTGYLDAGIYVGAISNTGGGTLTVHGNEMFGNNRGIIIEDSNAGTQDIAITGNIVHDNTFPGEGMPAGIFLTNSDGVLLTGNVSNNNGTYGFQLADSDDNEFNMNSATGNGTAPFFADGSSTGNCGVGNSFSIPACP